ncbi:class I SAM-dependent methyltransferase [Thermoactinomyces sp. DSM 45892]|uniref:tRNA (mnm(5)s(2)U34)-methyltransferase n=1 Tax=Thermoactinomyces sp. DSM 45892 TaxID=1882753 RepID=UPI0008978205|nr:class I SAM-dependent methyltransferase [Thermoactinomyces sp. DSM 45892]SDY16919.1 Putative rRNA methylase [Thermoactinomyces sp. DSM 45892]
MMKTLSTLQSAKYHVKRALQEHSHPTVVDATLGNGYDTLFLAKEVGTQGKVFGFDIQSLAIKKTTQRLQQEGFLERVTLFHVGHEYWEAFIPHGYKNQINAVMFNLGYLPHGDETIITSPETTLQAMEHACQWLAPRGVITIALYVGHEGGQNEANHVVNFASQLPSNQFQVTWTQTLNRTHAPSLVVIEKRK